VESKSFPKEQGVFMKSLIVGGMLAFCGVIQSWAQTALTPATPAISPAPVFVPSSPVLAPTATTPAFVSTNASLIALADALVVLQTNLQQTLPVLSTFNDNFDFVSLGDNGLGATSAAEPHGNFSANLATNFAVNLGVNAAMPTGSSLFNTVANRVNASADHPRYSARIISAAERYAADVAGSQRAEQWHDKLSGQFHQSLRCCPRKSMTRAAPSSALIDGALCLLGLPR
jgi:hypothetical protein